jgi:excisionase family DNA binding protein
MNKPAAIRGDALSVTEAAKRAYISKATLYGWIKKGNSPFPVIQVSPRKVKIDSADVDDWLRAIKRPAGQKKQRKEGGGGIGNTS